MPAISEDGQWRWDGQQWVSRVPVPVPAPAPQVPPAPHGAGEQPDLETVPLYRLRLFRHTGLLLGWLQSSQWYEGTYEQLRQSYRNAQTYCLLAGWWSILSVLALNWIALYRNHSALQELNRLAGRSA